MSVHTKIIAAAHDDDPYLCESCDAERAGPLAYCASCEEVTESYIGAPYGSVNASALEARVMADYARRDAVNLPARLDQIAARRVAA